MTTEPGSTLTAFFERRADAERAIERLREAGVAERSVSLDETSDRGDDAVQSPGRAVFEALGEFFSPQPDSAREGWLVTVGDVDVDGRENALRLLHDAGGVNVDAKGISGEPAASLPGEARPVQPGFADAAPGYVPKTAPFPPTRPADADHAPDELAESKGRFADQIDRLPERDRDSAARARRDDPR